MIRNGAMSQPTQRHTNRLLGYPDDARLLIINADDFGMCHAANAAITRSLTAGVVTSTTLFACLHNPEFLIRATAELWYVSLGQSGRQRRGTRRR
jgi:hypothetical protein